MIKISNQVNTRRVKEYQNCQYLKDITYFKWGGIQ